MSKVFTITRAHILVILVTLSVNLSTLRQGAQDAQEFDAGRLATLVGGETVPSRQKVEYHLVFEA